MMKANETKRYIIIENELSSAIWKLVAAWPSDYKFNSIGET